MKKFFALIAVVMIAGKVAVADSPETSSKLLILEEKAQQALLPAWVLECKQAALYKLKKQADAFGIDVDMSQLSIQQVDSGVIASYVWWSVPVIDIKDRTDLKTDSQKPVLTKLTQKPAFSDCF